MDYLIGLLSNVVEDQAQLRILVVVLSSLTVLALTLGIGFAVIGVMDPVRLRMRRLKHNTDNDLTSDSRENLLQQLIPSGQWQNSQTLSRLAHAGFRTKSAVADYYAIRIISSLFFPFLTFYLLQQFPGLGTEASLFSILAALAFGFILPSAILDKLISIRRRKLRNGFPDALDMLVVCVEAGLGLQAALQRVADELSISHAELAEELTLVNTEIRMGVERMEALKNMAYRTGLEDIKGLVTSLDQSIRFGTNIADTLRVYSEEFRDKRIQRAEEMAAKISTKMIFPLTFCLWPSFFLIMVGPAILGVLAVLATN